jgi:hypothetical protein
MMTELWFIKSFVEKNNEKEERTTRDFSFWMFAVISGSLINNLACQQQ